ncbi:MAG: transporter substrate-binding domain-containing protein [Synergistaceae bacterium]|nr:transporter substrate-binding domain-containing protein [Synergistaceae bacterium]
MKKLIALILVIASASMCMAGVENINDLKTAKKGVLKGSATEGFIREFIGEESENISAYDTFADTVKALKDGKVEAVVMDLAPATYIASEDKEIKILSESFKTEEYGIAFKKDNPLKAEVEKALKELKDEGTIESIFLKYMTDYVDPSTIDYNLNAKNGYLWVGCDASFPPYEMKTAYGFVGADIEMCAAIAKKLDRTLVVADYAFSMLPAALNDGRIDMICSAFIISEERKKTMDFTDSYASEVEAIVVLNK